MQLSRTIWQRIAIVLIAGLLASYVGGVLWHIQSIPDIGLNTTFRPVVNRAYPSYLRSTTTDPIPDLVGATIVAVGDRPIETWPQLLREIESLENSDFPEVENLTTSGLPRARCDGAEWVRVRLAHSEGGKPFAVWCLVGGPPSSTLLPSLLWIGLETVVFLIAAFVYWKRPMDRPARLFFALTTVVIGAFMGGYHWARIATQPALILVYMACSILLPAVFLHFYQLFPRPKSWFHRRPATTLAATYGLPTAFLIALLVCYVRLRSLARGGGETVDVLEALGAMRQVIYSYFGVAAALYLAGVFCLAHSFRVAQEAVERNQVRWIFFGSILATLPLGYALYLAIWNRREFGGGAALWPMFAASICFTAAFTISITRYRLMQLDQLVSSGMAYFLVSCLAAAVYYVLVFAGALIMDHHGAAGPSLEQAFWVSGSALVMTVGLDVARSRLRRVLDRRFRRDKSQLDRTVERLGEAIEQLVDPPRLADRLLHAVAELLGVPEGAVYLRAGDPPVFRAVGSLGREPGVTEFTADCPLTADLLRHEMLPPRDDDTAGAPAAQAQLADLGGKLAVGLAHENVLRAFLVLGPKADGGAFSDDDLNLIAAFVPFTALALASAEGHRTIETLNRELQSKVEKISEQQRRILALQQQLTRQAKIASPEPAPMAPPESIGEPLASDMLGTGPALRQVLALARKAAGSPSAVMVRGESGTGKGLLANAIHANSPRADKPFVKVHCAALAPTLLESELFGHVRGAFTGAVRDKVGRFEMADGGTLFLDEIGDISLDVQTKLLRVIQEKTFERVGSSEPTQVDVRLIAATHQNLEQLIRQGRFREDLFYRLNVIALSMPPLRERSEDVPELALHFLKCFAKRCDKTIAQIDDEALLALRAYRWPGNVRELENAIERAVVVADGDVLTADDLPDEVRRATTAPPDAEWASDEAPSFGMRAEREARDRRERDSLVRALDSAAGNKAEAARLMGMARSTLVSRLKKHGLLDARTN